MNPNLKQAVPFFSVTNIEASMRFYASGLGFAMTKDWQPDGKLRWCWLERGEAALILFPESEDDKQKQIKCSLDRGF